MIQVNITQLRKHLPAYLLKVNQGEELFVTSHGQVIAHIVPPTNTRKQALQKLKQLRSRCKIQDVISPLNDKWDVE